jgi:hypothetical protein
VGHPSESAALFTELRKGTQPIAPDPAQPEGARSLLAKQSQRLLRNWLPLVERYSFSRQR